jgi:hypothetical protein
MSDFEAWYQSEIEKGLDFDSHVELCRHIAEAAWNHQQAKLDAQAEELAALRKALVDIHGWLDDYDLAINLAFKKNKLIDADGNPTPLLTGEGK